MIRFGEAAIALLLAVVIAAVIALVLGCDTATAPAMAASTDTVYTCPVVDSTTRGVCVVHTTLYGPTNELLTVLNISYVECEWFAVEYSGYVAAWAPILRRE